MVIDLLLMDVDIETVVLDLVHDLLGLLEFLLLAFFDDVVEQLILDDLVVVPHLLVLERRINEDLVR